MGTAGAGAGAAGGVAPDAPHAPHAPDLRLLPSIGKRFAVRPTVDHDWPALKAVRLAALAESPQAFGVTLAAASANPDAQWRDRAAGMGAARFFLAFSSAASAGAGDEAVPAADADAIGMVAAVRIPDGNINLIAMWVDPHWRGLQHGRCEPVVAGGPQAAAGSLPARVADALIDAVKNHAVSTGATAVFLEVAPDNVPAVALYRRHGFCFHDHVEQLASHPHILIQRMGWVVPAPG